MRAKKILIVDDDPEYASSTRDILEAQGYAVITTASGNEGFELAVREKPALIMMDVMVAHASEGLDIVLRLAKDEATRAIPVLVITGIRKAVHLLGSYAPGAEWPNVKAIFEKPVPPDVLLAAVGKNTPAE